MRKSIGSLKGKDEEEEEEKRKQSQDKGAIEFHELNEAQQIVDCKIQKSIKLITIMSDSGHHYHYHYHNQYHISSDGLKK